MEDSTDQKQQKAVESSNKESKYKGRINNTNNSKNKFVGVRQRPSGKWVAEIKDTTQNIRMWLGTFNTPEDAAKAYDEAAFLLRGSNTRTNFSPHLHPSTLSFKIRNLLTHKISLRRNNISSSTTTTIKNPTIQTSSVCSGENRDTQMFENDAYYRPEMSCCIGGVDQFGDLYNLNDSWWRIPNGFDQNSLLSHQGIDEMANNGSRAEIELQQMTEIDCVKKERQISDSLLENSYEVGDIDAVWDFPMCQLFCPS